MFGIVYCIILSGDPDFEKRRFEAFEIWTWRRMD